ncbi:MAG TPA: hypothetical protein VMJ12_16965 [Candidatus Acidoferrales bacterium]|nr:hypothetical protein [Candidatus Acidoferrales bacterium]
MIGKFHGLAGAAAIGLITSISLAGCTQNRQAEFTFMPGPITYGGVEYYPAKPGARYHNQPIDYTTNPPPAGVFTFVHLVSTNGIVIRLKDAGNSTHQVTVPDLM